MRTRAPSPALLPLLTLSLVSCTGLERSPPAPAAWVVYDPGAGAIPLPNDLLRDGERGVLDLPVDGVSPAEAELRRWMNTLDGWSSASEVSVTLSAPPDPETLSAVEVWEWGDPPRRVEVTLAVDGPTLRITPPRHGWARGREHVVVVPDDLRTVDGLRFGPDAAMWYLRLDQPLDDPQHHRAFPGSTRAERMAAATRLEEERQRLAPILTALEERDDPLPREQVAALFTFTVTERTELAMDAASQRMPLPIDLLIDAETGLVDLPVAAWDDELEADAKRVASTLDGFAVSAGPSFELTGGIDPSTVPGSVRLLELTDAGAREVAVTTGAWSADGPCGPATLPDDCRILALDLHREEIPLRPGAVHVVVVGDELRDLDGQPVIPMPVGRLLLGTEPVVVDGRSAVGAVADDRAERVEVTRERVATLLDEADRDGVVAAWSYRTLDPVERLRGRIDTAEALGLEVRPQVISRMPPYDALGHDALDELFPGLLNPAPVLYLGRVDGVADVVEGVLMLPDFLDPETRRWTEDWTLQPVRFQATVPKGLAPGAAVPVLIFGHPIVTDRRMGLLIAGPLAKEGIATVTIDLPYHGHRIACVDASLVAIPNFLPPSLHGVTGFTEPLIWMPPCESGSGATCTPTGECLGPNGVEGFSSFPLIDLQPASGAAFLDVHDIPHIPDHFAQALVDLGGLRYSLQTADWSGVFGRPHHRDRFRYAGMSLGGILGAVYTPLDPAIDRAVLNVPGANLVDLFLDSTFFGPQMDAHMDALGVVPGTWEHRRLLDVARWLVDAVDPHSVGHRFAQDGTDALIQIDRIGPGAGDLVIPNHTTDTLQRVTGLPMIEYPSVLHGDLVIPVVGDAMLDDLVDFLAAP